MDKKSLTDGQRAYEARRAAKAGMSLEKWLTVKEKEAEAEARAKLKAAEPPKPPKPPGLLSRLIDRAHQPLKPGEAGAAAKPPAPKSGGAAAPAKGQAARRPVAHRRHSP